MLGLGAGLGACAGTLVPASCAWAFPPALLAIPCTAPLGAVAGTAIAANFDAGKPDLTPLFVAAAVGVVAARLAGTGVGAGVGVAFCNNDAQFCSLALLGWSVAGAVVGVGLAGPVVGGIAVAVTASQTAHTLTPSG